jgi:hypothetical protein
LEVAVVALTCDHKPRLELLRESGSPALTPRKGGQLRRLKTKYYWHPFMTLSNPRPIKSRINRLACPAPTEPAAENMAIHEPDYKTIAGMMNWSEFQLLTWFFKVLGRRIFAGPVFSASDEQRRVDMSHALWTTLSGADRRVICSGTIAHGPFVHVDVRRHTARWQGSLRKKAVSTR